MIDLSEGNLLGKEHLAIIKREISTVNKKRREFFTALKVLQYFFTDKYPEEKFGNDKNWQKLRLMISDIENDSLDSENIKRTYGSTLHVLADDEGGKRKALWGRIGDMYELLNKKGVKRKQDDKLSAIENEDRENLCSLVREIDMFLNCPEIQRDNDTEKVKREYQGKVQTFKRQENGQSLWRLIDETCELLNGVGVRRTFKSRMRRNYHEGRGLYTSNELCTICSLPLSGRQRKYCSDKCKEVAKNRRKDPANKARAQWKYWRECFPEEQ